MSEFRFVDVYRSQFLRPAEEIETARRKGFEALTEKWRSDREVATLVRLYFGLPTTNAEWFRSAFTAHDASFSLVQNERENALLAGCVLREELESSASVASLALLAGWLGGVRKPIVWPELVADAEIALQSAALLPSPDEEDADAEETEKASEEVRRMKALGASVGDLSERVEVLWWFVSHWSRWLDRPLESVDAALSPVSVGIDLAGLVQSISGPAAAAALLHRSLHPVLPMAKRAPTAPQIALGAVLEAAQKAKVPRIDLPAVLPEVRDLCPIHSMLEVVGEKQARAWVELGERCPGVKEDTSLDASAWALQTYRERLLLKAFDKDG